MAQTHHPAGKVCYDQAANDNNKFRCMLKVTGLSLLLGAAALIVILTQLFAPPTSGKSGIPSVYLTEEPAPLARSNGTSSTDGLEFNPLLNNAVLKRATGGIEAQDYPFMHIAIDDPPADLTISVSITADGQKSDWYQLEAPHPESVWLSLNEFAGWQGTVEAVELRLITGETLRIKDLSLHPAAPSRQLRAIVSDLTSFAPWKRAQMNTHTGVAKVASFYPVPLVMSWLLLSLTIYGLIVLFTKRAFSWTDVGMIFLVCWFGLDLIWQKRLTHQVIHSHHTFAGKTTEDKLLAGPDGRLFAFISQVKEHIDSPNARIFVASDDLYRGMRAAYYLYPFNSYWKLGGPQIPDPERMHKGDYVLLLGPTRVLLHRAKGIRRPETKYFPAKLLFNSASGKLIRLQ
ncbi:MAG: hypothetical protein HRT77_09280 [Halioglobus sp.]|nr:hypothetical protein [Halioglobus sp.]